MELIESANENVNFKVVDMIEQDNFSDKEKNSNSPKITKLTDEQHYKEVLLVNYQRYRALFHTMLINNILVDDKYIIRDINKKAKEEFAEIIGKTLKIGVSLTSLFHELKLNLVLQKLRQDQHLDNIIEFELTDSLGKKHQFKMEPILFISPNDNILFKCISIVKTFEFAG